MRCAKVNTCVTCWSSITMSIPTLLICNSALRTVPYHSVINSDVEHALKHNVEN